MSNAYDNNKDVVIKNIEGKPSPKPIEEDHHPENANEFEFYLRKIGSFGKAQKLQIFLLCLIPIATAFHNMGNVFYAGLPSHHCFVADKENQSREFLLNKSIPWEEKNGQWQLNECLLYDKNISGIWFENSTETKKCNRWTYDRSVFTNTIVTEWNLVCDDKWLIAFSQMIYMLGYFVGCFIVGDLSDRFGRRLTLVLCSVLQLSCGVGASFSPNYIVFTTVRFFVGFGTGGQRNSAYALLQEWCTEDLRIFAGVASELSWAVGYVMLGGMAYFARDWWILSLATSVPMIFFVLFQWLTYRSPRWLMTKGRDDEALEILIKAAKRNERPLPQDYKLRPFSLDHSAAKSSVLDPLRYPNMRMTTLIVWLNWFVVGMVFFGLSYNVGNLVGDLYLNNTLLGLVEFVAYIPCYFIMKLGRRWPLSLAMILSGVGCLTVMAIPDDLKMLTIVLSSIGKAGSAAVFAIIYVYTSEVYPTSIRTIGLGTGSMWARAGGMIAPYIALLGSSVEVLPFIIFGVAGVVTGLITVFLPETHGRPLIDTLEEAEVVNKLKCRCRDKSIEAGGEREVQEVYENQVFQSEPKENTKL